MAKEIYISAIPGLTISVQLYSAGVSYGSPVTATEIGSTGEYTADMPVAIPGIYLLVASTTADKIASSVMVWDGTKEVGSEIVSRMLEQFLAVEGYKDGVIAENSPTLRKAGDVELIITGYGTNFTTVEKVI